MRLFLGFFFMLKLVKELGCQVLCLSFNCIVFHCRLVSCLYHFKFVCVCVHRWFLEQFPLSLLPPPQSCPPLPMKRCSECRLVLLAGCHPPERRSRGRKSCCWFSRSGDFIVVVFFRPPSEMLALWLTSGSDFFLFSHPTFPEKSCRRKSAASTLKVVRHFGKNVCVFLYHVWSCS